MALNLQSLYDSLYQIGYHNNYKNHGLMYVGNLLFKLDFDSFLDVGCSQGAIVKVMQMAGKNAYGIDISTIAIDIGKQDLGLDTCVVGSAHDLPYEDDSFDVVFTSETIEHLPPKLAKKAVYELLRVAKKYVCAKIAYEPETNKNWIEAVNDKGYNIKNLHLTVKNEKYWRNLFQNGTNWKALYEYKGMIVYKKGGVD